MFVLVEAALSLTYTIHMVYAKKIQNHIKRVEGQVTGVKKMILEGESQSKVLTQLKASISSLESLKVELAKEQMKEKILENVKNSLGMD